MSTKQEQNISYALLNKLAGDRTVATTLLTFDNKHVTPQGMVPGYLWFLTQGKLELIRTNVSGDQGLVSIFDKIHQIVMTGHIFNNLLVTEVVESSSAEHFNASKGSILTGFCFSDLLSYGSRDVSGQNFLPELYLFVSNALRLQALKVTEKSLEQLTRFLYQKLAKYLLQQLELNKSNIINISHQELALLYRTDRVSITQQLVLMQDLGLIQQAFKKIIILDPVGLQEIADGRRKLNSGKLKSSTTTPAATAQ